MARSFKKMNAKSVQRSTRKFIAHEGGATAIEYGLIVGLIFLAVVGSIRAFTTSTNVMYNDISTAMDSTTP